MRPNRFLFTAILLVAIFLTACSAATSRDASEPAAPSAAEINAAAEQAAADQAATLSPATASPTETSPASSVLPDPTEPLVDESTADEAITDEVAAESGPRINRRVEVPEVHVNWLLPWDGIRPVYNPEFATAEEAPLKDDELVIGISLDGEAKAYPITVLRFREMVNDEMAGIPTLVTW
jgi:hypothetical protein